MFDLSISETGGKIAWTLAFARVTTGESGGFNARGNETTLR
jgi:hypothetical protein